jgi:hypothetical protein
VIQPGENRVLAGLLLLGAVVRYWHIARPSSVLSGICLLLRVGGRPRGKLCVAGLRTRRAWHSPWT